MDTFLSRLYAALIGAVIVGIGVLGFVNYLTPGGQLFGLLQVNAIHNGIHIVSGLVGLVLAFYRQGRYALGYMLGIGFAYGLVTLIGFAINGDFFDLAYFNLADNLVHAAIALSGLTLSMVVIVTRGDRETFATPLTPPGQSR